MGEFNLKPFIYSYAFKDVFEIFPDMFELHRSALVSLPTLPSVRALLTFTSPVYKDYSNLNWDIKNVSCHHYFLCTFVLVNNINVPITCKLSSRFEELCRTRNAQSSLWKRRLRTGFRDDREYRWTDQLPDLGFETQSFPQLPHICTTLDPPPSFSFRFPFPLKVRVWTTSSLLWKTT